MKAAAATMWATKIHRWLCWAAVIPLMFAVGIAAQPAKVPDLAAPAPSATNRVTAAATIHPASASPGETVTVLVKVRVAPGHHIYALDKSGTRNIPTTLETELPAILRPDGPWRGPEPKANEDGSRTLTGDVLFERRFVVEGQAAAGAFEGLLKLKYQLCNEALCWPPATIPLKLHLNVGRSQ